MVSHVQDSVGWVSVELTIYLQIFNPLYQWPYKCPFSKLILKYVFTTRIPGCSKLSLFAYLGTYFAMGCTLPLTIANYLMVGWIKGQLPNSYVTSWNVM